MTLIIDTLYTLGSSMLVKRWQYEKGNIRKCVHGEIGGLCRYMSSFHVLWSKPTNVETPICEAPTVNNFVII